MQTALQRRQRHRRQGAARRGRGGGSARRAALAIPLLLFSSFIVLGSVGFIGAVSAYSYYSRGLPDPTGAIEDIGFEQPSIVYDRTGEVELARFGTLRRQLVNFEDIPPEMIDATTSVEDKDYWTNPGFDIGAVVSAGLDTLSGRPRGASTITQQLVRARLLPADAFQGSVYDRKIREIIQSIRLTQAYPGEEGKKTIITAYLNQNFYGNQSYGVEAAAQGYFGKDLSELDLAQFAVIAAIPQSPTKYDLMRNAVRDCKVPVEEGGTCPDAQVTLRVPSDSDIVLRRNHVLELMKDPTRSVLSHDKHTAAEYDAAMKEPLILTPAAAAPWKAPHFVWQIRHQLGALLCGDDSADNCEAVDTGGYQVTTSLDWNIQQTVEKWLYASTRVTHLKTPAPVWTSLGIPESEFGWLRNLKGANIHNGAAGVIDYRTGQVLGYGGSGGYYLDGDPKFQPQFDVMFDGFRQPGSAIKPLNYIIGIENHTLTAATMFMDVVTDFGGKGSSFLPSQSDGYERGPVRLRNALQFSFNVPSIKAGIIQGIDLVFNREQEFGLHFPPGAIPVVSQSVGAIETHPIDLLDAYGAIANGGVLMPRTMILEVRDKDGKVVYPTDTTKPVGKRLVSPQSAYIITDILNGNTTKSVNPIWGKWQILEKTSDGPVRRPAAYKTGTTNDRKDTAAYGFVAPPQDPDAYALAVGVWMGNSDSTPNNDSLSLESSAPLWSRILTEITQNTPIAKFKRPEGLSDVTVDAFSGLLPGPGTVSTVKELFIKGTEPKQRDNLHVNVQIDSATGKLWQDGCTGPMVTENALDFSQAEPRFPQWQPFTQEWAQRAAKGPGVRGGPKKTRTMYFYSLGFHPFGATWGGKFAPTELCQPLVICPPGPPTPQPTDAVPCIPQPTPDQSHGNPHDTPPPTAGPTPTKGNKPTPTPKPTAAPATGAVLPLTFFPLLAPFAMFALGRRFKPGAKPDRKRRS
ncbi:MAG TPA: transglycosylase domain-containing protein [Candidatus Limnocylindrales bacterium]|nr:transglycosylase domain-containing protein [Candidatus Limnocylindrales bacterium]